MPGSVIIIDQSAERAARLDTTLLENGFLTTVALSKRTARQLVAQNGPDAVLVHTDLRDGCGFELAHEINRQPASKFTPLFLYSHRAREDDFARSFASGAIALLSLPEDMPDLLLRLPPLIRGKRLMGELDVRLPSEPEFGLAEAPTAFDHKAAPIRLQLHAGASIATDTLPDVKLVQDTVYDCRIVYNMSDLGLSSMAGYSAPQPPALLMADQISASEVQNALHVGVRDFLRPNADPNNIAAAVHYHSRFHKSRIAKEAEIEDAVRTAYMDPVTKTYNRSYGEKYIGKLSRKITTRPYGLMMVDLDHFKSVNDQFGHIEGDRALANAAAAMKNVLRNDSALFRWGGDEFLITCPGLDGPNIATFGARLMDVIQTVLLPDSTSLSASFGAVSLNASSEFDAIDLISKADQALYRAKAISRGQGQVA